MEKLLRDLERMLESADEERVRSVREVLARDFPETEAGAEANYKLGLHSLFRKQDMEEAANFFRLAAKSKQKKWVSPARLSLALLLFRQDKAQQALFELRKLAGQKPPDVQSAQALGFLAMILREQKKTKEAEQTRDEQKKMLLFLSEKGTGDRALAHYLLAMELKFDGDRGAAKKHFEKALELRELPPEETVRIQAALESL